MIYIAHLNSHAIVSNNTRTEKWLDVCTGKAVHGYIRLVILDELLTSPSRRPLQGHALTLCQLRSSQRSLPATVNDEGRIARHDSAWDQTWEQVRSQIV